MIQNVNAQSKGCVYNSEKTKANLNHFEVETFIANLEIVSARSQRPSHDGEGFSFIPSCRQHIAGGILLYIWYFIKINEKLYFFITNTSDCGCHTDAKSKNFENKDKI